jgi:hypothetical protein
MSCGPWRGAPPVVPVGGALDHLGIGAEGGIVHERAATLTVQIDQLRRSLEVVAAKVRRHEEAIRRLERGRKPG